MHPTLSPLESRPAALRFTPVLHLQTGEPVTILAETMKQFEERESYGPAAQIAEPKSPAAVIAEQVTKIARLAHDNTDVRPIMIAMPIAALIDPDTPLACDAAIRRTVLCHQEICFEISDASLTNRSKDIKQALIRLREIGFRLSLNATRSWQTPLSADLRILFEGLRVDRRQIELEDDLEKRIDTAASCGMHVIAEHANWRDGDWLESIGVELAVRPRADG